MSVEKPEKFGEYSLANIDAKILAIGQDKVEVIETSKEGKGIVTFEVNNPCLRIRVPEEPIKWLSSQCCADAILFESRNDGIKLHLVELKLTVKSKEWNHIKNQLSGAFLNAKAIAAVIGLTIKDVQAHIALKTDKITRCPTSEISLVKTGLGIPSLNGPEDWINKKISICDTDVPIKIIQRDDSGNALTNL